MLYPTDQFPTIASIPTGAVVYDTTDGVVKQKRQVGNFVNSGGTLKIDYVAVNNQFDANLDFELCIVFYQTSDDPVNFTGLLTQGSVAPASRGIWIERESLQDYYTIAFYDNTGAKRTINTPPLIISKYNDLKIKRVGDSVACYVNDVIFGALDLSGFIVNALGNITIGSQATARTMNGKIARCKLVQGTAGFDFCFCEGTGSAAVDSSGNGNNGTITDGAPNSFWDVQDLIPLSLLS